MDIGEKSILCLDLKVNSLDGKSSSDSGPNGQHVANSPICGSSVERGAILLCNNRIQPLISKVCKIVKHVF